MVTLRETSPADGSSGAPPDFGALFRALPSPHMILDRSLRFVDANEAYCKTTERRLDELIGRGLFEMFPNPGESGRLLRESVERVLATGQPDSIPVLSYPIQLPLSAGGGFQMRYWSCVHTPLLDEAGRTRFIVQNTVDVTELQALKEMAYGVAAEPAPGETQVLQRAREVQAANAALAEETRGLRDLFMNAPSFMAVMTAPNHTFAMVNTALQDLIGHRQVVGRALGEVMPEVSEQGFVAILDQVLGTGQPFIGQSMPVQLQRTEDGPLEERFVDFIFQPIRAAGGAILGVFVDGSDVTKRVQGDQQRKLLIDELNHRVKNTLATVQAIARQTLRATPEPVAFTDAFESRLMALSATHDLLTERNWKGADLRDLLLSEFRPFGAGRYDLSGPGAALSPGEAVALGLVFHELVTNAAKYGALSRDGGTVSVWWTLQDGHLELTWVEHGGPPVALPTRRGFGSRLIERSLEGGEASLDFAPGGLTCRIVLPLGGA